MKIDELYESTTSGAIATVATPMNGGDAIKRGTGVYPNKKGGNLLTGKKTSKKYANSISENKSIPIQFHTSELKPEQYRNYVIPHFEANNIDRPHPNYRTNLRLMSESKYNLAETKEFEEIQPLIQTINRLDSKKTVKVGDKFAVLAFEIIYFHKEIILYGFTKPVTVTKVSVNPDGSIIRIGFDNGDFYPRQPKVTLNKRSIEHAAYFDTEQEANHALTIIKLTIPDEWELDTTGLNVPFDRKGLEETLRRNHMKIKEINEDAKKITNKQQCIDYFVKRGKTAAQGAAAWDRGFRGPKPKDNTKKSNVPANAWWKDKDEITEAKVEAPNGATVELDPDKYYVWAWDGCVVVYGKYDDFDTARRNKYDIEERAVMRVGPYMEGKFRVASGSDLLSRYVTEAELQEDDLILVPGEGHRLKSGLMPNGSDRVDHEVQMARGDLFQTIKNSESILKLIHGRSEEAGLEGWVQAKITKASDYLNSVRQYLESKGVRETGGVIAGGGVGESMDEGIADKIKGTIRREKAKNLPLVQTRRDYAMGKAGEAYNKGDLRKGDQYSAWAERDRKKKGDPSDNPTGKYRTKTTDYKGN